MLKPQSYNQLLSLIQNELLSAQKKIGQIKAISYWKFGRWVDLYLLHGKDRAKYGGKVYEKLEKKTGIGARTLRRAVKFSQEFPILTARSKLTWTHFRELDLISDQTVRNQLVQKAARHNLTTRELKTEIKKKLTKHTTIDVTPPPKLKAVKGKFHTYVILEEKSSVDPTQSVVDCGFGIDLTVNTKDFPDAAFGQSMDFTYRAEVKKIIDADTFKVRFDLGLGGAYSRQKIRLKGIDAPEVDTPAGKKAKAYVEKVLKDLKSVTISTSKSDKYDRYLADLFYVPKLDQNNRKTTNVPRAFASDQAGSSSQNEKHLNQELLELGLARAWTV